MNDGLYRVSGNSQFSIRLAHARATILLSSRISPINKKSNSFVVSRNLQNAQQDMVWKFIQWCEQITMNKKNCVTLQLENNNSFENLQKTTIASGIS